MNTPDTKKKDRLVFEIGEILKEKFSTNTPPSKKDFQNGANTPPSKAKILLKGGYSQRIPLIPKNLGRVFLANYTD